MKFFLSTALLLLILGLLSACDKKPESVDSSLTPQTEYAQLIFVESSLGRSHSSGWSIGTFSPRTQISNYSFMSIEQLSTDDANPLMAPSMISIDNNPVMINQNGVYRIVVGVDGDSLVLDNFKYSGENNICVAKGLGWCMYITKDAWRQDKDR